MLAGSARGSFRSLSLRAGNLKPVHRLILRGDGNYGWKGSRKNHDSPYKRLNSKYSTIKRVRREATLTSDEIGKQGKVVRPPANQPAAAKIPEEESKEQLPASRNRAEANRPHWTIEHSIRTVLTVALTAAVGFVALFVILALCPCDLPTGSAPEVTHECALRLFKRLLTGLSCLDNPTFEEWWKWKTGT